MRSFATMICGSLFLSATAATAEAPRVVADIAPVHSLVARVMQGIGTPELILPPGRSPHGHAMRPSQAGLLADAALIVWAGEALTPWLALAIETLAPQASAVALLEADGTQHLAFREGATFEPDEHGHGSAAGHEGEAAEAHAHEAEQASVQPGEDAHDHAARSGHDDHDQAAQADPDHEAVASEAAHEDHGHGAEGGDPHAWLDPQNAITWLGAIAAALSQADPANAEAYAANAAAGASEIDALAGRLAAQLAPIEGRPFVVFHDAYHHFEHRFGIEAAGAITLGDASDPSPARVKEIRDRIVALDAACVFAEPQFEPGLIATVTEGTRARPGTLDPLGASLTPGPELYPQLLQALADDLVDCLG